MSTRCMAIGAVVCMSMAGCGQPHRRHTIAGLPQSVYAAAAPPTTTIIRGGYVRGDADVDDVNGADPADSNDDYPLSAFGRRADAADRKEISSVVERYYAAAAAHDGRRACQMVTAHLRSHPGSTRTVPEDRFSVTPHPHVSPGESCARVASDLFTRNDVELHGRPKAVQVTVVRTHGSHGLAIMALRATPERWIPVVREHGVWRVAALLGGTVP
jgi:hypothetical protein